MKPDFPLTWSLEPWSQSEGLLEIVHAKFQVNAAIFAAARLIFAAFTAFLQHLQHINRIKPDFPITCSLKCGAQSELGVEG